ncbi:lipid A deacylase LpxR family protein [Leptolyngbya sp. 15MV]|nr:lipid A deacylase LpxR family protein [Leptolyngbya sp. 15MV]
MVLQWRTLRFSYTQAWRSEEFLGQGRGGQAFGSVGVTARF